MNVIRTVLGDIVPEEAGITLTHEHTFLNWPGAEFDHRAAYDHAEVVEAVGGEMARSRENYHFQTLVDCTPADMGRNPAFMVDVAKRSGMHVVATTGFFCESMGVPYHWRRQSVDEIRDFFIRDITEGIAGTDGVRCGIIKIATGQDDAHPAPTPVGPHGRHIGVFEDRIIRAAALAQRELGVCITTHTDPHDWTVTNIGLEQLSLLEEEGADPAKVIIGHCFVASSVDDMVDILRRGASVQIDNIGTGWRGLDDEKVVDSAAKLVELGYEDQIVLTFDRFFYQRRGPHPFTELDPGVAPKMELEYMPEVFLPMMRERGVGDDVFDKIMRKNPARLLSFDA